MLSSVVFVPAAPLLVPELTGRGAEGAQGSAQVRAAVLGAVRAAAPLRWAVGSDSHDATLGPDAAGTFRGFGVDVSVALGPSAGPVAPMAPSALIAGWVRGAVDPASSVTMRLMARGSRPDRCSDVGASLRDEFGPADAQEGLLVVGDGCTTLTARAPGALDPRAAALQGGIEAALADADVAALAGLDPVLCDELGVGGRVPWQVAAGAAGAGWRGTVHYSGAPYGVGYSVVTWSR